MAIVVDNKWVKCYNIIMKYRVTHQHYDMKPGTVWYKVGVSGPETNMYGTEYFLVTEIEGDKSEGSLRVIPKSKLEEVT